jgi:leucine efflux protein
MRIEVVLGITDFWTYVLGAGAIVLLPGPNSIFVLTTAARRGVRTGYRAAAGVFLGDTVLMVLSAAGAASALRAYPPLFLVIKYAGAAYLGWVGLGIIRGAVRRWRGRSEPVDRGAVNQQDGHGKPVDLGVVHQQDGHGESVDRGVVHQRDSHGEPLDTGTARVTGLDSADREPADRRNPFRRSLVISLLNPKAILFFVSFFIQFVEPGYAHPALSFLVLGAVVQFFSVLYLTTLIFSGQFLAGQFQRRRRLTAALSTGMGALFVGFGLKLATASLS